LRELEKQFASELVVIGVHSGKYHAERVTERIRDASIRLGAEHPIVNDRQFRIWRSYVVSAWPTLVVIDPGGYVVGARPGEFTPEMLRPFIRQLVNTAETKGMLNRELLSVTPDPPSIAPGRLRYPGKVAVKDDQIAIADSGNHQVLVGRLSTDGQPMIIERVVGSGTPGFDNGENDDGASFDSPQGLAFVDGTVYVADTGNHAVRAINLTTGALSTIAGTGRQIRTPADREEGELSSPWDVVVKDGNMYIAMAGFTRSGRWILQTAGSASTQVPEGRTFEMGRTVKPYWRSRWESP
jgi:hypothetical protein